MNKLFALLLVAVSLFVSLSSNSTVIADKSQSGKASLLATPTPLAEIERIEVNKKEALIGCFCNGFKNFRGVCDQPDNLFIRVKTVARNPQNTPLIYDYKVSGGKTLGQGSEILWNLQETRPGTYTITSSIRGWRGVSSETKTEMVTVRECDCHCPCDCPTLGVYGGGAIRAGDNVNFVAQASGGSAAEIAYNWTVSQGEIIKGQGTPQITVKTSSVMTGEIKATVEINGSGLCADCPKTAFETATIMK